MGAPARLCRIFGGPCIGMILLAGGVHVVKAESVLKWPPVVASEEIDRAAAQMSVPAKYQDPEIAALAAKYGLPPPELEFHNGDEERIRQQLVTELAAIPVPTNAPPLEVHLRLRHYLAAVDGEAASVFVAMDWCVLHDTRLVVDELFFVSVHVADFSGRLEDVREVEQDARAAVVHYMVGRLLAACGGSASFQPGPSIHAAFDDAVSILPPDTQTGLRKSVSNATKGTQAGPGAPFPKIDWLKGLAAKKS